MLLLSPNTIVFQTSLSRNFKIKTYKTIILPVVLYGCETWSLILREKCRLFENRILRRIFSPKRDENGKWRTLLDDQLHSLYSSPNTVREIKSRKLRQAGHVARLEEGMSSFKFFTGKPMERDLEGYVDADGKTLLKWLIKKQVSIRGIGLIRLLTGIIGEPF